MSATEQLQAWLSYVPTLVARRFADDPTPTTPPIAERFPAAVLFADVDDFTRFAEQLNHAAGDSAGAEQLANILNNYFGRFIEIVHAHGGEVVKFAGDALLTLWTTKESQGPSFGNEAELALATHRAAQCALAIQAELHQYEIQQGTKWSMQMGLGAGYISAVHLGGLFNRLEFLLSGSPLTQISRAETMAQAGQIIAAPEAWQLINTIATGKQLNNGYVQLLTAQPIPPIPTTPPQLPPEAKTALQRYIPGAVRAYLNAGHLQWQAELRQITILFIHLPSYGTSIKHPYQHTLPKAQAVMLALQTALYRYEGSINKLNVDEKGITVVAALGVPPFAHEDDPLRGVRAAIDIQQALRQLGRPNAIGVTSGTVFCGTIGHPQRREYTMIGNPVNLSSRLMELVTDTAVSSENLGILCDHTTYLATQNLIKYDKLPPIPIRGKQGLISIYRPHMRRHIHHNQAAKRGKLIGRQQEIEQISQRLQQFRQHRRAHNQDIIIIEAEPGMGKSHFAGAVNQRARKMKLITFNGKGDQLQKYTPFRAWQPVFTTLFDLTNQFGTTAAQQRNHVLRQLPTAQGERGFPALALQYAPLLNAVLPLEINDNEFTRTLSTQKRQEATHQFLLRLLDLLLQRRSQPALFLFEDIHWLDTASLNLLFDVNQRLHRTLFLLTTPTLPHHPNYQRLRNCQQQRLHISPLTLDETERLLCQHLSVRTLPPDLIHLIHHTGQGNPYLSQCLAQSFVEQNILLRENGRFHFTPPTTLPLPPTIQRLNVRSLDQLPLPHQLVLKAASIIGPTFSRSQLQALLVDEFDETRLGRCLDALIELGFIQKGEQPDHFRFKYTFTQQTLRHLLPHSHHQHLHNKLAL